MLERKSFRVECKAAGDAGDFEAAIATLGVVDHDGDIIAPGAFGNATVSIVPAHDHTSVPLGKARIEERGDKAVAVGKFNLAIPAAKDWHSALRFDLAHPPAVQEWSFAFQTLEKRDEVRDGKRFRLLVRLDTMEISPVLRGAGIGTGTLAVKGRLSSDPKVAQLQLDYADACGEWIDEAEVKAYLARSADRARQASDRAEIECAKWLTTEAAIEFDELERQRYRFAYCTVDDRKQRAANTLAELAAGMLGIETPVVKFFRPAGPGERADFGYRSDIVGFTVGGDTCQGKAVIRVRDRDLGAMVGTIGHECRHVYQHAIGWKSRNRDEREADADAFGARFAAMLSLPQYADLVVGDGDPPMRLESDGLSLFGTFYLDRKARCVYAAAGDAPWPRWRFHRAVLQ